MSDTQPSDTSSQPSHKNEIPDTDSTTNSNPGQGIPTHSLYIGAKARMDQQDKDAPAAAPLEASVTKDAGSVKDPNDKANTETQVKEVKKEEKSKCQNPKHKHSDKPARKHAKLKSAKHAVTSDDDSTSDSDSDSSSSSESSSSESEEEHKKKKKSKSKKSKKLKKKSEKKSEKKKAKKSSKSKQVSDSSESEESDSDEDSDTEESESSSDESSAEEIKKKHKSKKAKPKKVVKIKQPSKIKKATDDKPIEDDSEESEASSDESSAEETKKKHKSKKVKPKKTVKIKLPRKSKKATDDELTEDDAALSTADDNAVLAYAELARKMSELQATIASTSKPKSRILARAPPKAVSKEEPKSGKKGSVHFRRVDELWDRETHHYKLKESAKEDDSEFAEYAFLVRRRFDWENKYLSTIIDIKSKQLRAALQGVMKDCKSVSLEAEEPSIDPNTLFVYLEELRKYYKKTLKSKIKKEKKRKTKKNLESQRTLLKTLVAYIDQDYASTKKTLYPLLEAGNITFDLMWALFHPGDLAVTSCYGIWDEPRCFKMEYATKLSSMARGQWYCVEGKYLEYDGKNFGYADFEVDVDHFQGPRKITSLATYPLKYHKEQEKVKKQMLERGEKFVSLEGMHYKFHKGLAFMKKKRQVIKVNINGRVMADPATFRRINPNYPISWIKPREAEELFSSICESDEEDSDCSCEDQEDPRLAMPGRPKYKYKWTKDEKGRIRLVAVEVDEDGEPIRRQQARSLSENAELRKRRFTEEDVLLASPVVLGFAFSEKFWLEFTISGIREITWNEDAYDSLVLPPSQKSIVRALVESHKTNGAKTIDDVVQGKGKGLVSVLHGPPGTGKTLTAEGISELLKCPLYMVSVGELGTNPSVLETELQKILDIAHGWGAVLLLDEADVFLEKRQVQDVHRNALVSIFLRLLEYFQGILFLTTNRVETFDEAFQSRIHVALRYGELTTQAKKKVWELFVKRVKDVEGMEVEDMQDHHYNTLSRHELNGRQIKNMVRTAQALALHEKTKLTMEHIRRVLDVAQTFEQDLKGGTGYIEAMRSYT